MVYIDAVKDITDSHGCTVIAEVKWTDVLHSQASKRSSKKT